MIHPSYTELIEAINTNSEDDDTTMSLNSRYSLVLAASKRARQIIAGSKPMVEGAEGKKPLSVAIDELYKGKVKILAPEEEDEEGTAQTAEAQTEEISEESAQASDSKGFWQGQDVFPDRRKDVPRYFQPKSVCRCPFPLLPHPCKPF